MRLSQSAVARRVVTCLLTLSLVALGGGLQWFAPQPPEPAYRAEASHEGPVALIVSYVATAAAVAVGAAMWLTRDDPDLPGSTSHIRRSDPLRPLPEVAQAAFKEQFGPRHDPRRTP